MNYKVKLIGDSTPVEIEADSATVIAGNLVLEKSNSVVVAIFAAGDWLRVTRE